MTRLPGPWGGLDPPGRSELISSDVPNETTGLAFRIP